MKALLTLCFLTITICSFAQFDHGFKYGQITWDDLNMKTYSRDTTADAVVLDEFAEAWIDSDNDNNLLLEHHIKIKILTKKGLDQANYKIYLRKGESKKELVRKAEATTYNSEDNKIKATPISANEIFTSDYSKYYDEYKLTLPDVKVGSIIEIRYMMESPFIFNFYPWEFQSEIPKVRSEFWARIPGNYVYNISLRGFLKLNKNESELVKDCFTPGPYRAECALYKYEMINVPAFVEEEHMTAKSNFISRIEYELSEIRHFDGRVQRYTKTWKDVDKEMNTEEDFGGQIKKGKNYWKDKVSAIVAEPDSKQRATQVYDLVKNWYSWNDTYGKYAELGAKKAYESRKGNVGDINLALIAALQEADLPALPLLLATREVGLPNELFPIISDFNYVVAYLEINNEKILLDATEPLLPFGLLPERCLNGRGRVIAKNEENSKWIDIRPNDKQKKQIVLNLKLADNLFTGDMTINSFGYEAFSKRSKIKSYDNVEKYREYMEGVSNDFKILGYDVENLDDISKPLIEKFLVQSTIDSPDPTTLYLNPFFVGRYEKNPFLSKERLYPVDFGAPLETTYLLSLEYPDTYEVDEMPESAAMVLPQSGGKFMFNMTHPGNKISMTSILNISKVVYSPAEYHYLKELFSRVINTHQSQIVFKKR